MSHFLFVDATLSQLSSQKAFIDEKFRKLFFKSAKAVCSKGKDTLKDFGHGVSG